MSLANNMTAALLIEIPKRFSGCRVWRQNTGMGVPIASVKQAIACIMARDYKGAIAALSYTNRFGIVGGGDVSGIMNGGRRMEIEVKAGKDKQSDEQKGFQEMIRSLGGIYLVCRDVSVTLAELEILYRGEGN